MFEMLIVHITSEADGS